MARAFLDLVGIAARVAALTACALVSLPLGCVHPVHVALDERADLSACRTWSWLPDPHRPASSAVPPELDALLRGAIERELAARGFERAREAEAPDFLVGYDLDRKLELVLKTETPAQQRLEAYGGGSGSGATPGAFEITASEQRLVRYEAGMLQLDVAQGAEPRLVWRAVWVGRARGELQQHLDAAVAALFERFPAGPVAPRR